MPKIPVYESQVSTGGVPQAARATADDFGAMTSEAIVGVTQAGLDLADAVIKARRAAETTRGEADATREIDAIVLLDAENDEPATWPERAKQRLDKAAARYRALDEGPYRDAALGTLRSFGPAALASVRITAAKREAARHRDELDATSDSYVDRAAGASNDLERQSYVNLAKAAIARAHAAGYIGREDALVRLGGLAARIEEKRAEALIARDPAAAAAALEDRNRFVNLAPAVRDLLRGKAMLARQKAGFAAVSALEQGLADGTKGRADVIALHERGAIGEAKRDALLKVAEQSEAARAEKAEGRERVDGVLRDGGTLDPATAADRAAVDAHYDAVVAPGDPDAAVLVGYAARTGMVPTRLGRRIRGGLASDDPQQAVNAASLLVELAKRDGRLTEGFGVQRLRFAKAVMAGIDGGLSPERAVALATKRHGEPDPGDDSAEIAEADAGSAVERRTTVDHGRESGGRSGDLGEPAPPDPRDGDDAERGESRDAATEPTRTTPGGDGDDERGIDDEAGAAIAADIKERLIAAGYRSVPEAEGRPGAVDWRDADGNPIDAATARRVVSDALIEHAARTGMPAGEFLSRRQRLVGDLPQDRTGDVQVALGPAVAALLLIESWPWIVAALGVVAAKMAIDQMLKNPGSSRFMLEHQEPPVLPGADPESVKPEDVRVPGHSVAEPQPTILVTPLEDPEGPAIEVYPDMSDALEQWLYIESRGEKYQQEDLKYIAARVYDGLDRRGVKRSHVGGGYNVETGAYQKERVYQPEKGKNKGSRRPDATMEIGENEKEILDINVVDTLADKHTMTKREREAFDAIVHLKTLPHNNAAGKTIYFSKSKRWTRAEWEDYVDQYVDQYLDSKYGRPKK